MNASIQCGPSVLSFEELRQRFNALAYDLVNEELARVAAENERLQAENDELRGRLAYAEDCAERWRDDALSNLNELSDSVDGAVGLTRSGCVLVVSP
jgi:regulator of replication initiation timing